MIKAFRAKSYGCLKDVEATLTSLHAFIGPNDSGKSTLLHGMRTLVQIASGGFHLNGGAPAPFDPFIPVRVPVQVGQVIVGDYPSSCVLASEVDGGWYVYDATGREDQPEPARSSLYEDPPMIH